MRYIAHVDRAEHIRGALHILHADDFFQVIAHALGQDQVVAHVVKWVFIHAHFVSRTGSDCCTLHTGQKLLVQLIEISAFLCPQIKACQGVFRDDIGCGAAFDDDAVNTCIRAHLLAQGVD